MFQVSSIKKVTRPVTHAVTQAAREASHSSHTWIQRQRNDKYVKLARYDNYRARSAYKLMQIDDKYKFLKPGSVVIEAGAAPGSWTQVICQRLGINKDFNMTTNPKAGLCIAVDIAAIEPVEGAICIGNADFTSPFTQSKILNWLNDRRADCVLSDMSPVDHGLKDFNHNLSVNLIKKLMPFALEVLKPGGVFLFKLWDGEETKKIGDDLKCVFESVKWIKPEASRSDSAELYILGRGFKSIKQ